MAVSAAAPQKAKVIRTLLSPFIVERSGMEWYCCKWPLPPLPLLFCYNNDNFIAFQPLTCALPGELANVRPSELSLFISLSTELGCFFREQKSPSGSLFLVRCVHLPCHITAEKHKDSTIIPVLFQCVTLLSYLKSYDCLPQNN